MEARRFQPTDLSSVLVVRLVGVHVSTHLGLVWFSLVLIHFLQCCGSTWYGSGSADPYLWLMDPHPDPAIFVSNLQDVNKKLIFLSIFVYYFLKVHLHYSKIKSHTEVIKQ